MKDYPWGNGTVRVSVDKTANDSDKSFTIPDGKVRKMTAVFVKLVCTATVGNRVVALSITDGTDEVYRTMNSGNITASSTGYLRFGPGITSSAATNEFALPELLLSAGYVVRVYDVAAIDAAADDMTVVLHYVEYDV